VTRSRVLLGVLAVVLAALVQGTVLARLPLPGAPADLVLVVVVAFGLAEGSRSGVLTGFGAGVLADLTSDHALGRLALAYAVVGYLAGLLRDDADRSVVLPFLAVAGLGVLAVAIYAGEGVLLGDPRITRGALVRSLATAVPYSVALTPLVVPIVGSLVRRLDADPLRR
jgi:rod shape-determining protein MreD